MLRPMLQPTMNPSWGRRRCWMVFFETAVRKPDAVDDRLVLPGAGRRGGGVARLRAQASRCPPRRIRIQRGQFAERLAVVVESCGQPDGVGETDAEHLAFERRMLHGVTLAHSQRPPGISPMARSSISTAWCARSMVSEKRMGFMMLRYMVSSGSFAYAAKVLKKNSR